MQCVPCRHGSERSGSVDLALLRLFAEEAGTTFRGYQQWARLLHAAKSMLAGHDLTRCAVDAGFASLSHYTDTFRRTFGLTPSAALVKSSVCIDVDS